MRFYVQLINQDLALRQQNNPRYSLRAYARDLGLEPSTLSKIMKGIRPLPLKVAGDVAKRLKLDSVQRTRFLESLNRTRTNIDEIKISEEDDRFMLDESYHKVIAEWEHYAVLSLYDCVDFIAEASHISKRLGISEERAEEVLSNLLTSGLLAMNDSGDLVKAHAVIRTTEDHKNKALVESHLEALDLAKQKLQGIDVELRDFSSSTLAIDPEMLPAAKTIIREFRMKMTSLLKEGKRKEVYNLTIQLYPLTQLESQGKSR